MSGFKITEKLKGTGFYELTLKSVRPQKSRVKVSKETVVLRRWG